MFLDRSYHWHRREHPEIIYTAIYYMIKADCCCSVSKSCPTLCDPRDCSMPGFPVLQHLLKYGQTHVHWVGNLIQPSHPLSTLFPPALILPSIKVFSNESALWVRWPKYWSFSFNINPSNEYSQLIYFRIDWFDVLAVQGTLKSLLQNIVWKYRFFGAQPSNCQHLLDHWKSKRVPEKHLFLLYWLCQSLWLCGSQ